VTVDLPDGPGGVGSDQLGEVSHQVSSALDDVDDVLEGAYLLEVSTPGVSRPLTEARHFRRAQGRLVTVQTSDGAVTGRVLDVDADALRLELQDRRRGTTTRTVPLAGISAGHVEVELRRSSDDD
jgi:ribosome maturation factor RimP